jgi:hypothetical protein
MHACWHWHAPLESLPVFDSQSKAVPLHAMVALGGERRCSSYSFLTLALDGVSGQHHTPGERTPSTNYWIAGWVGPRVGLGLDTEAGGKIICLYRGSNPNCPVIPVVRQLYWLSYPSSFIVILIIIKKWKNVLCWILKFNFYGKILKYKLPCCKSWFIGNWFP